MNQQNFAEGMNPLIQASSFYMHRVNILNFRKGMC